MAGRRGNKEGSIYQRSSDGRWLAVITIGYNDEGRPVRKTVSAKTRAQVAQKLNRLQRQIDDGLPPPDTTLTVAQLFDRWYADVLRHDVAPGAAGNYKSVADHHIVPTLGRRKVVDLSTSDIDRLISSKLDSGLSVSTVRRIRSVLAQALNQAIRWGSVNRNVASLTRAPREKRREGRTLTPDQAKHLLATLEGHRNEVLYALMISTGVRRGEALGLRWEDVSISNGTILVRRQLKREGGTLVVSDTKTARSRRSVNLPAPLIARMKLHKARQAAERLKIGPAWEDSGYVFTTTIGTPIDPRNLYREFKAICRRADLGDWHPHELRHSAASLMLAQGVKLQVVSEVLGHSSIRLTADVYGHILAPDRQSAADAMSTALWG